MSVRSLLVIGHSNAGKSPLGKLLCKALSHSGHAAYHLDFGELLRQTCGGIIEPGFSPDERRTIQAFMQGALLDDATFFVAERIVQWFLRQYALMPDTDILVLNGLPRHPGQAHRLAALDVAVAAVIYLDCSVEDAWKRKCLSETGRGFEDRSSRGDAAREVFVRKVRSFVNDTLPLLDFYRERNVPVLTAPVDEHTSPSGVLRHVTLPLERVVGYHVGNVDTLKKEAGRRITSRS